jgi:serine protease
MLRKTFLLAPLMLLSALSAESRERYLVATRPQAAGTGRVAAQSAGVAADRDSLVALETFDGFAADLDAHQLAALAASPEVRWIEPVIERQAFDFSAGRFEASVQAGGTQFTPWGLPSMQVPESWPARRGGVVNVVVIDTGIDINHEDLRDVYAGGFNVFSRDELPIDDASHGTHVAGTIGAIDNSVGVVGIVPGVRLWAAKVLDAEGRGTNEGVIRALDWTLARKQESGGRWVVNLSLGSARPSPAEREAVTRLLNEGVIVVAATGNGDSAGIGTRVSYPAAYAGVISVGAIDRQSAVAAFSNRGAEIDFVAPGVAVPSTLPPGYALSSQVSWRGQTVESKVIALSRLGDASGSFVFCGIGRPEEFPASVAGKIALIRRGELTFREKSTNAHAAGATAVIVFNNIDEPVTEVNWTLTTAEPEMLVTGISRAAGEAMLAEGGEVSVDLRDSGYGTISGTSMASPHVAGAVALLWSIAPEATPAQIYTALMTTATDVGAAGFDEIAGHGIPNVHDAARQLAPGTFDGRPQTGRRHLGRQGR